MRGGSRTGVGSGGGGSGSFEGRPQLKNIFVEKGDFFVGRGQGPDTRRVKLQVSE